MNAGKFCEYLSMFDGMRGEIEIKHRDILTGEIVDDVFADHNVILSQGKRMMIEAFTSPINSGNVVTTIKIGKDVGTGTILNPQPPSEFMTEAALDEVYATPPEEFFVTYPSDTSVRFLATINGGRVMEAYPGQPNVIYTSAMIASDNGRGFAYRRFPARTISSLISVEISWTIHFNDCERIDI